jgi:hypothetical protein
MATADVASPGHAEAGQCHKSSDNHHPPKDPLLFTLPLIGLQRELLTSVFRNYQDAGSS